MRRWSMGRRREGFGSKERIKMEGIQTANGCGFEGGHVGLLSFVHFYCYFLLGPFGHEGLIGVRPLGRHSGFDLMDSSG